MAVEQGKSGRRRAVRGALPDADLSGLGMAVGGPESEALGAGGDRLRTGAVVAAKSARRTNPAASHSKSRIVPVRFAPVDFERVEQAAGTNSVSVSEFVRQSVLHGSGRLESDDAAPRGLLGTDERALFGALLEEVRRVGVNVNQIALRLNAGRAVEAQAISSELSDLREMLGGLAFELRQLSLDPARSSSVNFDG